MRRPGRRLKPRALRRGDRIAVVAPASPFERDAFEAGLAELRSLGFEPVWDDRIFSRNGYLAGDADLRRAVLRDAWLDSSVAAVMAARGGYGSAHLLPLLDPRELRTTVKVLVGYSDVTALLAFLGLSCGIVTFHGPMVAGPLGRGADGYDRDTFVRLLTEAVPAGDLPIGASREVRAGEASGPLFGGNLTQIVSSLGTPFAFRPPPGSVLFIEEVGERPYRVDRMLTQLRLAGVLDRASALVFGEMPGCDEPEGEPTALHVIERAVRGFAGPVLFGYPAGHTTGPAVTLPLGVRVRVRCGTAPRLIIEESAVR